MPFESKISLGCPACDELIYREMSWFRKNFPTCPHCQQTLRGEQFDAALHALEQAMDLSIDEMLAPAGHGGCCGSKKSGCCGQ